MSSTDDIPSLQRPSFFDGQRLMAHDLTEVQASNRELRWLHNRSLHGWGIAFGFAVEGPRGTQTVKVDVGYAIDCMGRDLVLDGPIERPIPATASASDGGPATYYLTMSYAEDAQLDPVMRSGACKTFGAVRRPESPVIRWQDPNDTNPASRYRVGFDVVLASVQILNCRLSQDVSTRERRDALPQQQPFIATGGTAAGDTDWRLWPADDNPLGVATKVTTSGAGFRTTPRYQAHVAGERIFKSPSGNEAFLVDGYVQIAQATAMSFELRVILPVGTMVGAGRVYVITPDDYFEIASKALPMVFTQFENIAKNILLGLNGPRLQVGRQLKVHDDPDKFAEPLKTEDFEKQLKNIAQRNGITLEQLVAANGFNLDSVSLTIGQEIALPGDSLQLNPSQVLKPAFLEKFKSDLAWHVVWMGVEG